MGIVLVGGASLTCWTPARVGMGLFGIPKSGDPHLSVGATNTASAPHQTWIEAAQSATSPRNIVIVNNLLEKRAVWFIDRSLKS